MIVKMVILRLLGSSDDKEKEKIGVARPEGPPLWGFRYPVSGQGSRGSHPSRALKALRSVVPEEPTHEHRCIRWLSEEPTPWQKGIEAKSAYGHRMNRRVKKGNRCIGRPMFQRRCQEPRRSFFSTGSIDGASEYCVDAMTSAPRRIFLSTG